MYKFTVHLRIDDPLRYHMFSAFLECFIHYDVSEFSFKRSPCFLICSAVFYDYEDCISAQRFYRRNHLKMHSTPGQRDYFDNLVASGGIDFSEVKVNV